MLILQHLKMAAIFYESYEKTQFLLSHLLWTFIQPVNVLDYLLIR